MKRLLLVAALLIGCGQPVGPATRTEACARAESPSVVLDRHEFCVGVARCGVYRNVQMVCRPHVMGESSVCDLPLTSPPDYLPTMSCNNAACPSLWECREFNHPNVMSANITKWCFPGASCRPTSTPEASANDASASD